MTRECFECKSHLSQKDGGLPGSEWNKAHRNTVTDARVKGKEVVNEDN